MTESGRTGDGQGMDTRQTPDGRSLGVLGEYWGGVRGSSGGVLGSSGVFWECSGDFWGGLLECFILRVTLIFYYHFR